MSFYIAQRSKDGKTFQLWDKDSKPHEFRDEAKAIENYETAVRFEGINNVLLLKEVDIKVDVTVSALPQEEGR